MSEDAERWLAIADNRSEWARLERALALEPGFGLFIVDVPDPGTEARVAALLERAFPAVVELDARDERERSPVRELLRRRGELALLRGVEACRSEPGALERCLAQLNQRRDVLAARGHRLVLCVRRDVSARLRDFAPDLYSVHRAAFRFIRYMTPRPSPRWLVSDVEYVAALDDDGQPFVEQVESWSMMTFAGLRSMLELLGPGADALTPERELKLARAYCRLESVPFPRALDELDLAAALELPSSEGAPELLSRTRQIAESRGDRMLGFVATAALAWGYLHDGAFEQARACKREALTLANDLGLLVSQRAGVLEYVCEVTIGAGGEYIRERSQHLRLGLVDSRSHAAILGAEANLELARLGWERWGHADVELQLGVSQLGGLFDPWRLDAMFQALPRRSLERIVAPTERRDTQTWLRERAPITDRNWSSAWAIQLMIVRALEDGAATAELLELGHQRLASRRDVDSYFVWRPLVDVHAQAGDRDRLAELVAHALDPTAVGARSSAVLCIVADLLERGLVELAPRSRAELLERAQRRGSLPMHERVGWWAIAIALGDSDALLTPEP